MSCAGKSTSSDALDVDQPVSESRGLQSPSDGMRPSLIGPLALLLIDVNRLKSTTSSAVPRAIAFFEVPPVDDSPRNRHRTRWSGVEFSGSSHRAHLAAPCSAWSNVYSIITRHSRAADMRSPFRWGWRSPSERWRRERRGTVAKRGRIAYRAKNIVRVATGRSSNVTESTRGYRRSGDGAPCGLTPGVQQRGNRQHSSRVTFVESKSAFPSFELQLKLGEFKQAEPGITRHPQNDTFVWRRSAATLKPDIARIRTMAVERAPGSTSLSMFSIVSRQGHRHRRLGAGLSIGLISSPSAQVVNRSTPISAFRVDVTASVRSS